MPYPLAEIVHAIPRRVHLRAQALAGQREACVRLAGLLARDPSNERVSIRHRTGSVVVEREAGGLDAPKIAELLAALVAKEHDDQGRALSELPKCDEHGPTRIARVVAHAVAGINRDVSHALGHRADLGTLFSIALAAGGISEVLVSEELPGATWFNLLWWSLRSFMTFNVEAVESEMDDHAQNGDGRHELLAE